MSETAWHSDDPQQWSTCYEAWYQIAGAKAVSVDRYCRADKVAAKAAEDALAEALKKVSELGLSVEASCWTVKRRTRSQTQKPENIKEYVTADWHGRITQILKSIYDSEKVRTP